MKKLFFLAALAVMVIASSCNKSKDDEPVVRDTYVGKYMVEQIKIHCVWKNDLSEDETKDYTIPIDFIDPLKITADPNDANGIIFDHNIIKGKATVNGREFQLENFNYSKEWDGFLTGYGCHLDVINNPGVFEYDALGLKVLKWTATFTGDASGALIGIETTKNVSGTIEFRCVENKL